MVGMGNSVVGEVSNFVDCGHYPGFLQAKPCPLFGWAAIVGVVFHLIIYNALLSNLLQAMLQGGSLQKDI